MKYSSLDLLFQKIQNISAVWFYAALISLSMNASAGIPYSDTPIFRCEPVDSSMSGEIGIHEPLPEATDQAGRLMIIGNIATPDYNVDFFGAGFVFTIPFVGTVIQDAAPWVGEEPTSTRLVLDKESGRAEITKKFWKGYVSLLTKPDFIFSTKLNCKKSM